MGVAERDRLRRLINCSTPAKLDTLKKVHIYYLWLLSVVKLDGQILLHVDGTITTQLVDSSEQNLLPECVPDTR